MRYFLVIVASLFIVFVLDTQLMSTSIAQQKKESWVAPKTADDVKNPFKGNESTLQDAKKLYVKSCLSCHGSEGAGDGSQSTTLNPKPANLKNKTVQEQTDGAIFWKISNGKGQMVSWKFTLSDKQRWYLVNYIRELGKKSKKEMPNGN
jgi:mono/diheme cytochrome c family protein